MTAAPVAPEDSAGYAVTFRFAVRHVRGWAVETKPIPFGTARWVPSEGVSRTESEEEPGNRATRVLDPPPSRSSASSAPSDFRQLASSTYVMPTRRAACGGGGRRARRYGPG
ncbi:hypothetical protein GCM10022225_72080 [Plantactinospora mayteni]|uniref:Uncharacterized protein n=1 Tax=Plantactinospora mayteni TaxID=566021 RepID=A0ABQ4F1B9_9ACTN|nr:hypothetical protein Pma05_72340 [Plantactinospora mayteni]